MLCEEPKVKVEGMSECARVCKHVHICKSGYTTVQEYLTSSLYSPPNRGSPGAAPEARRVGKATHVLQLMLRVLRCTGTFDDAGERADIYVCHAGTPLYSAHSHGTDDAQPSPMFQICVRPRRRWWLA